MWRCLTGAVVVLQNEVPEAVNLRVAAAAGAARVVLNAAPAREVDARLMARVDVLVVNRGEAAALAGTGDPEAAAVALRAKGPDVVIVTLGGEGLVAASGRAWCGWRRPGSRSCPRMARGMPSPARSRRGWRGATGSRRRCGSRKGPPP
jgi:sugar/nucleoside kinase (ribokinase family)